MDHLFSKKKIDKPRQDIRGYTNTTCARCTNSCTGGCASNCSVACTDYCHALASYA